MHASLMETLSAPKEDAKGLVSEMYRSIWGRKKTSPAPQESTTCLKSEYLVPNRVDILQPNPSGGLRAQQHTSGSQAGSSWIWCCEMAKLNSATRSAAAAEVRFKTPGRRDGVPKNSKQARGPPIPLFRINQVPV